MPCDEILHCMVCFSFSCCVIFMSTIETCASLVGSGVGQSHECEDIPNVLARAYGSVTVETPMHNRIREIRSRHVVTRDNPKENKSKNKKKKVRKCLRIHIPSSYQYKIVATPGWYGSTMCVCPARPQPYQRVHDDGALSSLERLQPADPSQQDWQECALSIQRIPALLLVILAVTYWNCY